MREEVAVGLYDWFANYKEVLQVLDSPAKQQKNGELNPKNVVLIILESFSYEFIQDIKGEKGTVIMFICNHCPYVKAVINNIVSDVTIV